MLMQRMLSYYVPDEECVLHDGQRRQEEVRQLPGGRGKRQRSRRSGSTSPFNTYLLFNKT